MDNRDPQPEIYECSKKEVQDIQKWTEIPDKKHQKGHTINTLIT